MPELSEEDFERYPRYVTLVTKTSFINVSASLLRRTTTGNGQHIIYEVCATGTTSAITQISEGLNDRA